jgi:hypothetical protein
LTLNVEIQELGLSYHLVLKIYNILEEYSEVKQQREEKLAQFLAPRRFTVRIQW